MKAFLIIIAASTLGFSAYAQNLCPNANSYQSLVECAVSNSPEVQSAKLELERTKAQVQAAGQWRNPEFSGETFSGKRGNEDLKETDLTLGIPIELGGKISARKNVAESAVAFAQAKLYETQSEVRSSFLLKLHRLRQVLHEQQLAEEAIRTFTRLVSQYQRRPALSPEQQLSLSVYGLSKSEYDLKKSATTDEVLALDTFFKKQVGLSVSDLKNSLPPSPKTWPNVQLNELTKLSPRQQVLEAELSAAKADLSIAQSEAWPTLIIGPSYKMQTDGPTSNNMMGLNLSLPLPLFNANGAAKTAASTGVKLSEVKRQLGLREIQLRREELVKVYTQAVDVLRTSLSHDEIEKRHSQSENLFLKGVAPSSLVIETHRTSFELEKTRHEREIKALETLLEIYTLEGTILEKNL